jgi:Zn-dependent protease
MDATKVIFNVVLMVGPLILAIAVHEWAHVAMARFLGDDLGTREGRFTLNPIAHIDPIWTLALPIFLVVMSTAAGGAGIPFFAAGKPAPYNPNRLDRQFGGKRISLRTAEMLVAAAGPFSNLVLAILCVGILAVLKATGIGLTGQVSPAWLLVMFIQLNVALMVFNLIPIPPLDGSKVLMSLLPRDKAARYEEVATSMSWILLGLLIWKGWLLIGIPVSWISGFLIGLA